MRMQRFKVRLFYRFHPVSTRLLKKPSYRKIFHVIVFDMKTSSYHPEHGGAIFYILFAIAMIAALTFALNKGSKMSGSTLSGDKSRLAAQEIISFAETVASTVDKLKLRGFTDTQISFENNLHTVYTNANCTQTACKVFAIGGGSLNYTAPNAGWLDDSYSTQSHYGKWFFTGNLNIDGTRTTETDLVLMLPYVAKEVCEKINETLDLAAPTVTDSFSGTVDYFNGAAGDYTAAAAPNIGDTATSYSGKKLFCFKSAANEYQVVQVLINR